MPLMASPGAAKEAQGALSRTRSQGGPSEGGAVTLSAGGGCMHRRMAVALYTEEL